MRRALLLCGGLGLSACAHPVVEPVVPAEAPPAGVVVRARDETYRVSGDDRQALTTSVQAGGVVQGQRRYFGFHRWTITWSLQLAERDGQCAVTDATVFVDSRMTLPEWSMPPGAEPSLREQWTEFLAALREHELGHRRIIVLGAARVRETLLAVHAPSCDGMTDAATFAAGEVLTLLRVADAGYDEETRHGITQGAAWPPYTGTVEVSF
ncbi:MAG: DUF922 domain-containing protein [Gemmatimonadales bacterium]